MRIDVDRVISPRTYDPEIRIRVEGISLDLLVKKQKGEDLTVQEFAVLALIEAFENA